MMTPRTLLEALIQKPHGCNVHGEAEDAPVAILWTDPRSEWKPLIPLLRQQLPEHQQGPALWLRCIVDRSLPAAEAAAGQIPVIYANGWEAHLSAWRALAMASTAQEDVVRTVVAALLRPWLDDTATRFQKAVASSGLPAPSDQGAIAADPGEVLLFADGLRYDVARQLQKELEVMGITGSLTTRWAGLPTVTATAKPAITPLIGEIQGQALPEDFAPSFGSGKPTSAAELRKALTAQGYTVLADNELNIPAGPDARGWLEIGDLDHRGHQLQNDLPRQIQPEIERLALRIQKLLYGCFAPMACPLLSCPSTSPPANGPAALPSRVNPRCQCSPQPGAGTPASNSPPPTALLASTQGAATPMPMAASACRSASPPCWWSPAASALHRPRPSQKSVGRGCAATWR